MAKKTLKRTGRKASPTPAKKKEKKVRESWLAEYNRFFSAPNATPSSFQILDMTDGGLTTISSHS